MNCPGISPFCKQGFLRTPASVQMTVAAYPLAPYGEPSVACRSYRKFPIQRCGVRFQFTHIPRGEWHHIHAISQAHMRTPHSGLEGNVLRRVSSCLASIASPLDARVKAQRW